MPNLQLEILLDPYLLFGAKTLPGNVYPTSNVRDYEIRDLKFYYDEISFPSFINEEIITFTRQHGLQIHVNRIEMVPHSISGLATSTTVQINKPYKSLRTIFIGFYSDFYRNTTITGAVTGYSSRKFSRMN